ncbi:MAG: pilus assembly protein CpaE, partial [Alphaproteobacteria bacterium]|nr:pilus assembly protein CpaE [Alphaproteobacteria bacterium]
LAGARDIIRMLSWLKSNAPTSEILVVASRVDTKTGSEIHRKDFEKSIEHSIDFVIPYDAKIMHQAAKLGKPVVEAARGSKVSLMIAQITKRVIDRESTGDAKDANAQTGAPQTAASEKGKSLFSKFGDFKKLTAGKQKKAA